MRPSCLCGSELTADRQCEECDQFFCEMCVTIGQKRTLCDDCAATLGVEPFGGTRGEVEEAEKIARDCLTRGGWSGADLDFLQRVADRAECNPDTLIIVTDMKGQREREEALRR